MTDIEKNLLIKDLSCRLPYRVKVHAKYSDDLGETIEVDGIVKMIDADGIVGIEVMYDTSSSFIGVDIDDVKPYLFPLSSMTEEQKQEYTYIVNYISSDDTENWKEGEFIYVEQFTQLMCFYLVNHFDYMGLIPIGLANDATGLNIY